MSVQCKICSKTFKAITNKHLATHNISTTEYKEKYGPMVDDAYRKLKSNQSSGKNNPNYGKKHTQSVKDNISRKNKGNIPHNKGISLSENAKLNLSKKAIARNKVWAETNTHPVKGQIRSESTKQKIKDARKKQVITSEQCYKALQTKKDNGYDLAFFRGHKHTQETKQLISISAKMTAKIKHKQSLQDGTKRLIEYGYNMIDYNDGIITIQCLTCNTTFNRTKQYCHPSKITAEMCPVCYPQVIGTSKSEKEIADFLAQYTTIVTNDRTIITPKEIDIYLPEYKLAIEYNGLYWHSEIYKDKNYHIEKTIKCHSNGIRLIHIFEDEWINKPDIVKSRLLNAIGVNKKKIYARKCVVTELTSKVSNKFIKENHIQGTGRANVHLGLFYQDELVSVMTFLNGDISKRVKGWELNRFCSKLHYNVVGGAGKLFKHFTREYNPQTIISFADKRWSAINPFYKKIGFSKEYTTTPNYWYILPNQILRTHRYSLKKPKNSILTEQELRESEGYIRLYDCGSEKFVWKNREINSS